MLTILLSQVHLCEKVSGVAALLLRPVILVVQLTPFLLFFVVLVLLVFLVGLLSLVENVHLQKFPLEFGKGKFFLDFGSYVPESRLLGEDSLLVGVGIV